MEWHAYHCDPWSSDDLDSAFGGSRFGGGEISAANLLGVAGDCGAFEWGLLCPAGCGSDRADGGDLCRAADGDEELGLYGVGRALALGAVSRFYDGMVRDGSGDF